MTETPTVETPTVEEAEIPAPAGPESVKCQHCGKKQELAPGADRDFLCEKCEHYQDQMLCPTCHSVVRASLMKGSK